MTEQDKKYIESLKENAAILFADSDFYDVIETIGAEACKVLFRRIYLHTQISNYSKSSKG